VPVVIIFTAALASRAQHLSSEARCVIILWSLLLFCQCSGMSLDQRANQKNVSFPPQILCFIKCAGGALHGTLYLIPMFRTLSSKTDRSYQTLSSPYTCLLSS